MSLKRTVLAYLDQHLDEAVSLLHERSVVKLIRDKINNDKDLTPGEYMELLDILQEELYS